MLVPLRLVAVARDVTWLPADVTGLGAVRAVAGYVARLVAVVASLAGAVASTFGAIPCDMPRLVAVVAGRLIRALRALACYMACTVTSEMYTSHVRYKKTINP